MTQNSDCFDWETYINNYEDLRNAGINIYESALNHWINHGEKEGRTYMPINFDWETYISNYEDLKNSGINNYESALEHWNNFGKKEKGDDNEDLSVNGKYVIIASRHIIGYDKHETIIEVASSSTGNDFIPANNPLQNSELLEY